MENKTCKGCKWNNYPECNGTIMDGEKMKIDNLRPIFNCGVKDRDEINVMNFNTPSKIELLQEKFDDLEARFTELEKR